MFDGNITDLVKTILIQKPKTRDDDRYLLSLVWAAKYGRTKLENDNGMELLKAYVSGGLPSSESVRRTRQKLQEQFEELRGEKYQERQSSLESSVRESVRNWL